MATNDNFAHGRVRVSVQDEKDKKFGRDVAKTLTAAGLTLSEHPKGKRRTPGVVIGVHHGSVEVDFYTTQEWPASRSAYKRFESVAGQALRAAYSGRVAEVERIAHKAFRVLVNRR